MPTSYHEADDSVKDLASDILCRYVNHKPIVDAKVTIDYLFAVAGEDGAPALKLHGVKCLGICRKVNLKDRSKGNADAEICLDHQWWQDASHEERAALLDHELNHIEVVMDLKLGRFKRDSANRPVLAMRQHDYEFGWFNLIALRHGPASQERIQAAKIFDDAGQLYWPELAGVAMPSELANSIKNGELKITVNGNGPLADQFRKAVQDAE